MSSQLRLRPEEAGIDAEKLELLLARVRRDVETGVLPSAQVALARHGQLIGMWTYGSAVVGGSRRSVTNDTLYCIFSCTKAIVATAIWALFEAGKLDLGDRIAEIIPAFGANHKDTITVEHVLLHTGGFPGASLDPLNWSDVDKRARAFADWSLEWEPGSRFEYHAVSAHWVLAALIEDRTGRAFQRHVRERVLDRLGLNNLFVGLPSELNARVADIEYVTPPVEPPGGWGVVSPEFVLGFNNPDVRAVGVPGAGGFGTAGDLAMFYQSLIRGGMTPSGDRVLNPETIAWATRVRTTEVHRDPVQDIPVNRALGVVVAGDDGAAHMRGFGRGTSPAAIGHGGAGGQIGWGDPATGISVGYCTNGFVDALTSGRRMTAIGSLAAACALPDRGA